MIYDEHKTFKLNMLKQSKKALNMQDGTFCKSAGFILHIHRSKSPQKRFGKGRPFKSILGGWLNKWVDDQELHLYNVNKSIGGQDESATCFGNTQ